MATQTTKADYQENVKAALEILARFQPLQPGEHRESPLGWHVESVPDPVQLAQLHAMLAIAAAVRGIWMDCDC